MGVGVGVGVCLVSVTANLTPQATEWPKGNTNGFSAICIHVGMDFIFLKLLRSKVAV